MNPNLLIAVVAVVAVVAVLLSIPAIARVGETVAECEARYGKPVTAEGAVRNYLKKEFRIACHFQGGKCIRIGFVKPGKSILELRVKLTDDEIALFMKANSGGVEWGVPDDTFGKRVWETTDGKRVAVSYADRELLSITTAAIAAPRLDIKALAGKSPKEVQAILGAPESTEETKHGPKLTFKEESIEIVFIAGKADWICFTPIKTIPFTKAAMSHLGLPDREPTFSNEHVIRWEPCGDYISVSLRLRRHPEIAAFIRREQRAAAEANRLERWQLVDWLQRVIRTPVGEIDAASPLAQEFEESTTAAGVARRRVKMVDKLEAAKQLAALLGWTAPEHGHDPVAITVRIGGHDAR